MKNGFRRYVARARDAFVPGTSPTAREVAGAYDAARFGFEPLRDGAAKASPTPRSGGRGARGATTLPTNRVGALVRAFGAHVRATETDILKKCERLVDPTSVGFFELSKAASRRRTLDGAIREEDGESAREKVRGNVRARMNRPTDDSTRSNEQVKAVLEMLRDEGRLAAETDVSGEDARENRRTTRTSAKKGDKKSVLIVDDVACVRKFHAGQIGRLGYQSIEAGEGTEALRLYGEITAIQGILLDLMMPVMDGYSTANEIRALEEKQDLRRMPIIAVTSLTDQEMKANSKSTAFDGHVDKPTSMSKLATIFESMRMVPDVSPLDMRSIVASKDAETAPHGLKRLHRSKTTSSSNITSDKNDSKNGSNEGSEEKCQRGSDSNGDARSSGDSGNNLTRLDGLDNSAKRPNDEVQTPRNTSRAMEQRRIERRLTTRVGARQRGKSTMDKTANQNRPQKTNAAHVKAQAAPVNIPSPDSEAPIGKGGNAPVPAPTKTDPKSKDDPKAKDATKKTATDHVHRSCARCGSDETRFCYYNNGLTGAAPVLLPLVSTILD